MVLKQAVSQSEESLLNVYASSEGLISVEVRRTGGEAAPYIGVAVLFILIFTVLTSLRLDPVTSKFYEAIVGVFCPLFALTAAFGAILWSGKSAFSKARTHVVETLL